MLCLKFCSMYYVVTLGSYPSVVSFLFPLSVGIKSHCLTLCLVFGKFEGKCKRKKLEGKNVFLKKLISLIFYFYFLLLYKKMK